MYTLRLTRPLLASFDPEPDTSTPPVTTTRLGDWHVQAVHAGRRDLLQCTSGATLLTVMLPADALESLPERLAIGLVALLRRLAVPEQVIAAEVDEMANGVIRRTSSRAVLGAMRGLASVARRELERPRRGVDVAALHQALAAYRSLRNGRRTVAQVARERLLTP